MDFGKKCIPPLPSPIHSISSIYTCEQYFIFNVISIDKIVVIIFMFESINDGVGFKGTHIMLNDQLPEFYNSKNWV